MPKYLVEALTTASPFGSEKRKGLSVPRLIRVVWAPNPEEAVAECYNACSVLDLVVGIRFRVTPLVFKEASEIWAQYENPNATKPHERYPDYGKVLIGRGQTIDEMREGVKNG